MSATVDTALIRKALDYAGYESAEATVEELRICFVEYADAGIWSNVDPDNVEHIEPAHMAKALMRLR